MMKLLRQLLSVFFLEKYWLLRLYIRLLALLSYHQRMQRLFPLNLARPATSICSSLFQAGACGPRAAAAQVNTSANGSRSCTHLLHLISPALPLLSVGTLSMRPHTPPHSACVSTQRVSQQCRTSLRRFSSSSGSSSSSSSSQTSSSRVIFQPALTIPRFLRAFAITQAAACFVNGAIIVFLHNPLTGGALKSVSAVFVVCLVPHHWRYYSHLLLLPLPSETHGSASVLSCLAPSRCGAYPPT